MADNAIAVYQRVENPLAFCDSMALAFASVVGCDERQGKAMAMQALCEGLNPMQLQRRYHWIQGKPSMRADAMRAEFRMNHGGDFEIIESNGDVAHIKFTDAKGRSYDSRITWEQAQQEPWPWKKGCGPGTKETEPTIANLKDNWATPLSRANMLMARATSTALRYLCPELVAGVYTPEEMGDVGDMAAPAPAAARQSAAEVAAERTAQPATTITSPPAEPTSSLAAADGDVVDAEYVEKQPSESQFADPDAPGSITEKQITQINESGVELFGTEAWADKLSASLAKRNASILRNLSWKQADEFLGLLVENLRNVRAAAKN